MAAASVAILPDQRIARWRPLVHWALSIPHLAYTLVLEVLSLVAAVAGALWVIVTGRVAVRLTEFQVYAVRERVRTYSYFFALRESYPPFAKGVTGIEPGDDPQTHVDSTGPVRVPRWAPIARLLAALPHALVLAPIGVVLDLFYPVWMLVVAVNGGWPTEMGGFVVRVEEWVAELLLYTTMASDRAPQFGFGLTVPARPPAAVVASTGSSVTTVSLPALDSTPAEAPA